MSAGEIAGLVAAFAFVLLVGAAMWPLLKLGRTVDELTLTVRAVREEHVAKSSLTVDETNELLASVNTQLRHVDAIATSAQTVSGNAATMSSLVAVTFGRPLIRTAAFSYGVRRALAERRNGSGGARRRKAS